MKTQHALAATVVLLLLTGCAGTVALQPAVSSLNDLPIPEGMRYVPERSAVIEGASVRAARLVYRARYEAGSVAISMREGLEAKGWRHVGTVTTSARQISQMYEKPGSSLQVVVWEGTWYTYLEATLARVGGPAPSPSIAATR